MLAEKKRIVAEQHKKEKVRPHALTHARTHARTNTRTHTHTHAHTRTSTHTHTQAELAQAKAAQLLLCGHTRYLGAPTHNPHPHTHTHTHTHTNK